MSSGNSAWRLEVHDIPISVLIRPTTPELDEEKVFSLMETIEKEEESGCVPPIDVLLVKGSAGREHYYCLGGYHRYEAYSRLQRQTIPAKVIRTAKDLKNYLFPSPPPPDALSQLYIDALSATPWKFRARF